jgi:DNA-binding transcriptional regulator YhcF (GntR family)
MTAIAHKQLWESVADQLREEILDGRLPAGARLVETELAERFGVSRGPIRDALRELARSGLALDLPRRGTFADGALREVREETALGAADLEAFMETDIVNWFHESAVDAILCEAVFAARVRPGATVRLSHEHDDARWLSADEARALVVWPAYRRAIDHLEWQLAHPEHAAAYRLPDPA